MGLFSSSPVTHLPPVKGRRLDGTDVRFPQDLPADATLLILLFDDALDPLADQWARLAERLAETHGDRFAALELPVVGKQLKMLGDLGTLGIRGHIDDEAERARTVPIFVDRTVFRKALKLDKRDVTVLLVARDGRIAWRGEGNIDIEEIETLEEAIAEVLAAPIPAPSDHPDLSDDGETVIDAADGEADEGPLIPDDGANDETEEL